MANTSYLNPCKFLTVCKYDFQPLLRSHHKGGLKMVLNKKIGDPFRIGEFDPRMLHKLIHTCIKSLSVSGSERDETRLYTHVD